MSDEPTRPSLLIRVADHTDAAAWAEFAAWVGHIVTRFLRRRGLPPADAEDIVQGLLLTLAEWVRSHTYEPERGGFRRLLYTAARRRLLDHYRKRRPNGLTDADLDRLESRDLAPEFDQAFADGVLRRAAAVVRGEFTPPTFAAFWLTYVEGKTTAEAAAGLGLTASAVKTARSRVRARVEAVIRADGVY